MQASSRALPRLQCHAQARHAVALGGRTSEKRTGPFSGPAGNVAIAPSVDDAGVSGERRRLLTGRGHAGVDQHQVHLVYLKLV